jgi:hypothetical protein
LPTATCTSRPGSSASSSRTDDWFGDLRDSIGIVSRVLAHRETRDLGVAFLDAHIDELLARMRDDEAAWFLGGIAGAFCDPDRKAKITALVAPRASKIDGAQASVTARSSKPITASRWSRTSSRRCTACSMEPRRHSAALPLGDKPRPSMQGDLSATAIARRIAPR